MAKKLTLEEAFRWAHQEGLDCKIIYHKDSEQCQLHVIDRNGATVGMIFGVFGYVDSNGFPQDAAKDFDLVMEEHGHPQPQLTLVK